MLQSFRRKGPHISLFKPVDDLSLLSIDKNVNNLNSNLDEINSDLERFVIGARKGTVLVAHTILKLDFWQKSKLEKGVFDIKGASNFRYKV